MKGSAETLESLKHHITVSLESFGGIFKRMAVALVRALAIRTDGFNNKISSLINHISAIKVFAVVYTFIDKLALIVDLPRLSAPAKGINV